MEQCPALAITRDDATGAVQIHDHRCIGCGYCSWACPYDAPVFAEDSGGMTKCTSCDHRLSEGLNPACVTGCPTGCLEWGSLDSDGYGESIDGFPDQRIDPAIRFRPLRDDRTVPEMRTWPGEEQLLASWVAATVPTTRPRRNRRPITLSSEWPLLVFTLVFAGLLAVHARLVVEGYPRFTAPFLVTGFLAMGLSSLHLGRKLRSWRAVLNVRRSWLSREIVLYAAFISLAGVWQLVQPGSRALSWSALLAGLLGLYAVDRVYDLKSRRPPAGPDSASVLFTGGLFIALILGQPLPAAGILLLKLILWFRSRKPGFFRPVLSILGILAWALGEGTMAGAGLVLLVSAEILDRAVFYRLLDFSTPGAACDFRPDRRSGSIAGAGSL
jgi:ferredoxin